MIYCRSQVMKKCEELIRDGHGPQFVVRFPLRSAIDGYALNQRPIGNLVYIVRDEQECVLYVGMTAGLLRARLRTHWHENRGKSVLGEVIRQYYPSSFSWSIEAFMVESQLSMWERYHIYKLHPKINRQANRYVI